MYAQSKLGSRFFIPARFLPPKYNYYIDKADALKKEVVNYLHIESDYESRRIVQFVWMI